VVVAWNPAATAISYTVYRSTTAGVTGAAIGTTTNTRLVDSSPVPGTTYYYSVTASHAGGTSASSAQVSGYAAAPPQG
jgi:fibronectin type 3 domain-containing protein